MVAPMGILTTIIADDRDLLDAASAACPSSPDSFRDPNHSILIRLTTARASPTGVSCDIAVEGSRLRLQGPDFQGWADAETGIGECSVPRRLFGDPASLADEITDTLILFLLTRSGRTPVHAAGLVARGTTLLIAGPSGSGKSSLAFAWARRGRPILSDDMVFVQVKPVLRLWGIPRPVHLHPKDARGEKGPLRQRNGKTKVSISLAVPSQNGAAERATVILIERGERVSLDQVEPAAAVGALMNLEEGFDLLRAESEEAARAIVGESAWRLTLGRDPDDAVDVLTAQFMPG